MATLNVPGTYSTVQAALNAALSGDTIEIADGTALVESNINRAVSNITIKAQTVSYPPTVSINGSSSANSILKFYTGWVVEGIKFLNAGNSTTYAGAEGNGSSRVATIRKCTFQNCYNSIKNVATTGDISQCTIISGLGAGIFSTAGQTPTIRACVVYDCTGEGITSVGSLIENCTVVGCAGTYAINGGTTSAIKNCIAQANTSATAGIRGSTATNCNSYGNTAAYSVTTQTSCLTVDSLFMNVVSRDLSLSSTSSMRAGGTTVTITADAKLVSFGTPPSIGALEYVAVEWNPDAGEYILSNHDINDVNVLVGFRTAYTQPPFILLTRGPGSLRLRSPGGPYKVTR